MTEERLISEKEFRHMLGDIGKTTFWKMEQGDGFPARVTLPMAAARKVYLWSEAVEYIKNLVVFSRHGHKTPVNASERGRAIT